MFIESPREHLTHWGGKAKHPVKIALHGQYFNIAHSKVIPDFVRNIKKNFKQPNSVKYVVITAQMVKLSLTENYWLTTGLRAKRKVWFMCWKCCVDKLLPMRGFSLYSSFLTFFTFPLCFTKHGHYFCSSPWPFNIIAE